MVAPLKLSCLGKQLEGIRTQAFPTIPRPAVYFADFAFWPKTA